MHNIASEENYHDAQIIFKEGSSGDWVYVILSGAVEIFRIVKGRKIIIAVLKPAEMFGELGFLGGIKRTATARAIGETTLGIINREFLDEEYNKIHGYFRSILQTVVERFKQMIDDKVSAFSSRKHPRIQKMLSLEFKDHISFFKTYAANIGEGGLFLRTENPLKEGERFSLNLQLPDIPDPLEIQCEVAWARKQGDKGKVIAGMGVKFCKMAEKDSQILKQYLNAHLIIEKNNV
jgi:uncharacterized protein (TIGR02266 family)